MRKRIFTGSIWKSSSYGNCCIFGYNSWNLDDHLVTMAHRKISHLSLVPTDPALLGDKLNPLKTIWRLCIEFLILLTILWTPSSVSSQSSPPPSWLALLWTQSWEISPDSLQTLQSHAPQPCHLVWATESAENNKVIK